MTRIEILCASEAEFPLTYCLVYYHVLNKDSFYYFIAVARTTKPTKPSADLGW